MYTYSEYDILDPHLKAAPLRSQGSFRVPVRANGPAGDGREELSVKSRNSTTLNGLKAPVRCLCVAPPGAPRSR